MATTINSGYASSPKLTANIADHADVHGGRALVFDGVSDYLDIVKNFTGAFSISFWIYPHDVTDSGVGVIGISPQDSNYIRQGSQSLYIRIASAGSTYSTGNVLSNNVWTFLTITRDDSNVLKWYVDGAYTGSSATQSGTFEIEHIGKSAIHHFDGALSDLKFYSSALTEAEVQSQYLKPESVPSPSTLVAWYPMCEANPESPQSIVYDHSKKGKLGSELVTNGDMGNLADAGSNGYAFIPSSGWVYKHSGNSGGESTQFSQSDNGALRIFSNYEGISYYTVGAQVSVITGTLYKLTFDAKTNDASKTNLGVRYSNGNNMAYGNNGLDVGATLTTSFQTFTYYFVPDAHNNPGKAVHFGRTHNTSVGHTNSVDATIDNVSVKEILFGNHAQTNFFGDDLQTGTWNNSDLVGFTGASADGFTAVNTDASVGDNDNAYGDEISFVAGKTYQLSFTNTINSGTMPSIFVGVTSGTGGSADNIMSYATFSSANNYSYTFTPTSTVTRRPSFRFTGNGTYNFTISNFAVKEVGISSTGFATADSEPTIPQVPLMRYNEKMVFDGVDDKITGIGNCPTGDFTISAWILLKNGVSWYAIYSASLEIWFGVGDSEQLRVHIGSNLAYADTGNSVLTLGKIHHVVVTWNGSSAQIYVDGVATTTTASGSLINAVSTVAQIGANQTSNYYDGLIDDVSVFNTAFNSTQVQELFNDGVALDATTHSKKGNLLGYWRNDGVTTWQDRRGWSYLDFDGSSDEVTLDSELTFSGVFSVSFWVKHNSSGAEYVIGKSSGDQDFFYAHPTNPRWKINNVIASSNTAMAVGVWHHVLGVRDSSNVLKWYLNGSAGALWTGSAYLTTGVTRSGDFDINYFGKSSVGSYGEIELANVAFFNTDKSSSASTFYNNGLSYDYTTESGITNYYKMDSSSTLLDRVGSVNGTVDATLNTGNSGSVQGSPDSITIREGLNTNRDGLGFYFTNPSSNVLRLNGVNEYVVTPDTDLALTEQITIECWAKNNSADLATDEYLVNQYETASGSNRSWLFRMLSDEQLRVVWSSNGTNYSLTETSSAITNVNTWRHYVVTIASGVPKIYVDGEVQTIDSVYNSSGLQTSLHNSVSNIFVGRYANNNDTNWNGLIDEVKIYNRALSLSEIQKNYKHGKGKHKND